MRIFICDKCKKEFPQAIEEYTYRDEHGVWHVMDLCAPCNNNLKSEKDSVHKNFLKKK